jgi:hypothetical protein
MEDDIDRSNLNLFVNDAKEKLEDRKTPEDQKTPENQEKTKDYLYIYIPEGGEWEDFIITDTSEKALKLVKKNNGRIEIFKKDVNGLYKPTYI